MKIINVFEAKARLSELLDMVVAGKDVVLGRYGEPIAVLTMYRAPAAKRKLGGLKKSGYIMSSDFNAPLPTSLFLGEEAGDLVKGKK